MADIFLSYSREDQITARRYAEALKAEGFNVWWDQALDAGESFDKVTEQALKDAKAVVVLWSRRSVDSRWVRAEATQADRFGTLVPVTIEPCNRPIMFELTHTADLSGWSGDPAAPLWRAFIEGLRRTVGKTTTMPVIPASNAPASPSAGAPPRRGPRVPLIWMALAAVVLLASGGWWVYRDRQTAAPVANGEVSVAVLPFRDMSPNKDQEYWADGVTEEILNALASIRGLRVTARTSSFAFKDKSVSLREVGRTLDVSYILEGSIRKDSDQLRIVAQLIDTHTDGQLWSRTYNRPLQDVFKVQEEISREVAEMLAVSLGVGEGAQVPGFTRNVEAYDAFLEANQALASRSAENAQRGIDLLKKAVALDPAFAAAWARLDFAYGDPASTLLPPPPGKSWGQLADEAFNEARHLAPNAYYVYYGQIQRSMLQGKWSEVATLTDQLETIASRQGIPANVDGLRSQFAMVVGRTRDAMAIQEQVRRRNPLDANAAWLLGEIYSYSGNFKAALDEFDRGQKLGIPAEPLWAAAVMTAMAAGDRKLIEARLDAVISKRTVGFDVYTAMRPRLDKPAEALAELRRLHAGKPLPQADATIAAWAAYFGDPAFALEILSTMEPRGRPGDILRYWRPIMKDVRKLPGFKELVSEPGLVDYWRTNGWGDFCQPIGQTDFECK